MVSNLPHLFFSKQTTLSAKRTIYPPKPYFQEIFIVFSQRANISKVKITKKLNLNSKRLQSDSVMMYSYSVLYSNKAQRHYIYILVLKQYFLYYFQKSMKAIKSIEKTLFDTLRRAQIVKMEIKQIFFAYSLFKFLLKDTFILLIVLIQLTGLQNIQKTLKKYLINNSQLISISSFSFVAATFIIYVLRKYYKHALLKINDYVVPWVDVVGFPILWVSITSSKVSSHILIQLFSVINVLGLCFLLLCFNLLNFSKFPKVQNLFQFREARTVMLTYVLQLVFCIYVAVSWVQVPNFSSQQLKVYCTLKFILTALKFNQKVLYYFYIHPFSQKVSCLFYFIETNISTISLAMAFLRINLISTNFIYILGVMTSFAYISFSVYMETRDRSFFLSSANDIKTEEDALIYLNCLKELVRKIENGEQDLILTSLKNQHLMQCVKTGCFCQKDSKNLKLFNQNYVKKQLQILQKNFQRSISVLLSILYFKMILFKLYPEILSKLEEYQERYNFNVHERFYSYSLKLYVQNYINRKNLQIKASESDKIFKLQQLILQIKNTLRQEIELRQKKWRYLTLGICQVSQVKNYCQKLVESIKRVIQIQRDNQNEFKISKQFNLLLLFYMTKVTFLGDDWKITQNLRRIYENYRVTSFKSIKEFNKYIFHKRSCAIETKIDEDINKMGIITAVSNNLQEVFGIPHQKAVGQSISILMPQMVYKQHQQILRNWVHSATWKTIGKLKEVYCIEKNLICFSAILYLKAYTKQTGLYFITSIFKLNDNDYIMLNENGEIEGMGRRPLKFLGQNAKGVPLRLLINSQLGYLKNNTFEQGIVRHEIIMSLKQVPSQITEHLKPKLNDIDLKQSEQLFYKSLCDFDPSCYKISFIASKFSVGNAKFTILKILQCRQKRKMKTDGFLPYTINQIGSVMSSNLKNHHQVDKETSSSEDIVGVCNLLESTSMNSLKQRDNLPLTRIKGKFLDFIESPDRIKDKRMINQTRGLIIIAILLTILNLSSYFIYKSLLIQVEQIYIADGSVSDIMQLTEIAFDHLSNLKIELTQNNIKEFDSELNSAKYVLQHVYGLRKDSFSSLLKKKTSFHKFIQFMYIKDQAKWTLVNQDITIKIHQFFQNMYYLTQQLTVQLQNLRNSNKTAIDPKNLAQFNQNYLVMLINNFQEMKRINEFQLVNYQSYSDVSFDWLDKISIISISLHLVITLVGALLINTYSHFRFNQSEESFKFFTHVPQIFIEKLKEYFSDLKILIIGQKKLHQNNRLEDLLEVDTSNLFFHFKSKLSLNLKLRIISYKTYYKWIFILILLVSTNGLSYLTTDYMRNFFAPSKKAIEYINELMRKQNRKLEAYFNLKASFYLNPNIITDSYLSNLKIHLNSSLTTFNEVATNLTQVLSSYDPNFQSNFKQALIADICNLSSLSLPPIQNQKCKEELQYKILKKGIMVSMNYYQVIIQFTLSQMRQFYVLKNKSEPNRTYFRQKDYTELDKMQIYMFRIYQLTQTVCYNSTQYIIADITNKFLYLNVGFSIFYLILLILWAIGCKKEKQKLSKLYGLLVLIPVNILKSNSRIINTLKTIVQFDEQ